MGPEASRLLLLLAPVGLPDASKMATTQHQALAFPLKRVSPLFRAGG